MIDLTGRQTCISLYVHIYMYVFMCTYMYFSHNNGWAIGAKGVTRKPPVPTQQRSHPRENLQGTKKMVRMVLYSTPPRPKSVVRLKDFALAIFTRSRKARR